MVHQATCDQSVQNLSEIEQSPAELMKIWRIFAHIMSRCDLDLGPLDFELLRHFGCHALNSIQNLRKIE